MPKKIPNVSLTVEINREGIKKMLEEGYDKPPKEDILSVFRCLHDDIAHSDWKNKTSIEMDLCINKDGKLSDFDGLVIAKITAKQTNEAFRHIDTFLRVLANTLHIHFGGE